MRELPTSASLLLTEDCNLRCTYCFECHNTNRMSKDVARKAIDWLSDNAVKMGSGSFSVLLFGGEPLLNIDTIEETLAYGVQIGAEKGLRFTASMVTNATVMNDRIYSVLRRYRDQVNLGIQLSVDGIPEVQDRYRLTVAGKGSWHMVEKNLPRFKELYDNNSDDGRLSIHGCINKETMPYLYKNYKFFREDLGFKRIWFLPVAEEKWDMDDVKIYREENQKIFDDYIAEIAESMNIRDSFNYAPFDRYDGLGCRPDAPCGAGRSFVTITAEGDIYPCHQIYFNDPEKDTCIGNVMEGELDEDRRRIFTQYEEEDIGCGDCPNTQCYRCLAANYVYNGGLFSQIRGVYCALSGVDNYFQRKLKEALENLGLLSKEAPAETMDCLCNSREGLVKDGCDIVNRQENCQSGNNPDNPGCLCNVNLGNAPANNEPQPESTIPIEVQLAEIREQLLMINSKLDMLLGGEA